LVRLRLIPSCISGLLLGGLLIRRLLLRGLLLGRLFLPGLTRLLALF